MRSKDSNVHSDAQHMSMADELRNEKSLISMRSIDDKGSQKEDFG
jgi:hypothetical protein